MSKNVFNKCYKESIIFKDQLKKFDKDRVYEVRNFKKVRNMTYLIVGASSGLGRELASSFAKQKKDLIIVSRDERDLTAIKSDLEAKYKVKVNFIALDFSSIEEIDEKLLSKEELLTGLQGALFPVGMMFEEDNLNLNAKICKN